MDAFNPGDPLAIASAPDAREELLAAIVRVIGDYQAAHHQRPPTYQEILEDIAAQVRAGNLAQGVTSKSQLSRYIVELVQARRLVREEGLRGVMVPTMARRGRRAKRDRS